MFKKYAGNGCYSETPPFLHIDFIQGRCPTWKPPSPLWRLSLKPVKWSRLILRPCNRANVPMRRCYSSNSNSKGSPLVGIWIFPMCPSQCVPCKLGLFKLVLNSSQLILFEAAEENPGPNAIYYAQVPCRQSSPSHCISKGSSDGRPWPSGAARWPQLSWPQRHLAATTNSEKISCIKWCYSKQPW